MPDRERDAQFEGPWPPLLLVRHGQDRRDGGTDPGLTLQGRAQARALAERVAEHRGRYRVVYCSPRRRARETAEILAASLGLPTIVDPRLANVPDGVRALPALWGLESSMGRLRACDGAIVVTHAGPLRFLLVRPEGMRRLAWLWRQIPHCCAVTYQPSPRRLDMDGPLALYSLGLAVGLLASAGPRPSPATWLSHATALGAYAAARRLTRRDEASRLVALIAGGALASTMAALGPSCRANRKVMALNAWAFRAAARLPRLTAVTLHPNGVAGGLAVSLGLLGGLARHPAPATRAAGCVGAVASLAALILTACRSGWAAGAAAALTLGTMRGRPALLRTLGASVAGLGGLVASGSRPALGQPSVLSTESMAMRWTRWRATADILWRTPFVGVGLGRLPAVCRAERGEGAFKTPNSTPLQVWADAGAAGIVALAWGLSRGIRVLRAARSSPRVAPSWFVEALTSALVALTIHGAFEVDHAIVWARGRDHGYLASPLPYLLLGALSGLADRLGTHARPPSRRPAVRPGFIRAARALLRPLWRGGRIYVTRG